MAGRHPKRWNTLSDTLDLQVDDAARGPVVMAVLPLRRWVVGFETMSSLVSVKGSKCPVEEQRDEHR